MASKDVRDNHTTRIQSVSPAINLRMEPTMSGSFSRPGISPNSKTQTQATTPPDHIISLLMEQLQQALLDNALVDLEGLLDQFNLYRKTSQDYLKYNHTDLLECVITALKLTAPPTQHPHTPAT